MLIRQRSDVSGASARTEALDLSLPDHPAQDGLHGRRADAVNCQLSTVNSVNFAPIYLNGNYARNFSFAKDSGFFVLKNFLEDKA